MTHLDFWRALIHQFFARMKNNHSKSYKAFSIQCRKNHHKLILLPNLNNFIKELNRFKKRLSVPSAWTKPSVRPSCNILRTSFISGKIVISPIIWFTHFRIFWMKPKKLKILVLTWFWWSMTFGWRCSRSLFDRSGITVRSIH